MPYTANETPHVSFRFPAAVRQALDRLADARGKTRTQVLCELVLKESGKKPKKMPKKT